MGPKQTDKGLVNGDRKNGVERDEVGGPVNGVAAGSTRNPDRLEVRTVAGVLNCGLLCSRSCTLGTLVSPQDFQAAGRQRYLNELRRARDTYLTYLG
jgi:hypothetical protein